MSSSWAISAIAIVRAARILRVSVPKTVFTMAIRALPSGVLGPVDLPPWKLHTRFPFMAGRPHCCLVRFDSAWQRLQVIRPPASWIKGVVIWVFI
jgi:hypothetical protein